AFPVSAKWADGSLPPELVLAIDHAARDATTPSQIRVDASVSDDLLAQWRSDTGVAFVRGQPWRWNAAPPSSFASAITLLQGEFAAAAVAQPGNRMRSFRPAIVIAIAALVLHVVATLGEWAWWRIDAWRSARTMRALAVAAGASPSDTQT